MNSKLPKVYVNKINKILNVNQESTISKGNHESIDLDNILNDKNKYLFNHRYIITLNDNTTLTDSIISKKSNYLLTINNLKIKIEDIKSITEIKE